MHASPIRFLSSPARSIAAALAGVIVLGAMAALQGAPARRPNIVMVMADDLGWGDVAYNGNKKVKTPSLDQLAHDGVRLDRFYTAPVCTPTRASCLTGRSPNRYGALWAGRYPLPTEEVTIADVLKGAGYRTGFFGKWHLGKMTPERDEGFPGPKLPPNAYTAPWHHGFEVVFATESAMPNYNPLVWDDDWNLNSTAKTANKYIMDRPLVYGEGTLVGKPLPKWPFNFWTAEHKQAPGPIAGDASEVIMSPALDFIKESAAKQEPFLAVVWFVTPHTPVAAGPVSRAAYSQLTMREQHWYGAITGMDEQIGRLRDTLRKLGLEQDTIVWFCSDNGPSWVHELNSAGPFRGQKGDVYEGGIRTPSIVIWPSGIEGGRVVNAAVSTLDFLPTFLASAGVDASGKLPVLDGENVLPLLQGTTKARTKALFYDYPTRAASDTWKTGEIHQFAVIDGDWKLVSVDGGKKFQLFNLTKDIAEKMDVAGAHSDQVKAMQTKFSHWSEQCAASLKGADYHR